MSFSVNNYSQIDKLWSIMPMIYSWTVVALSGYSSRGVLMAVLVTIWGVRLTYNFGRKGGYSWRFWTGEEDYRWAVLRQNPLLASPVGWFLFNLFFISFYQTFLILGFTLPMILIVEETPSPLVSLDHVAAFLMLSFILLESLADNQQWAF